MREAVLDASIVLDWFVPPAATRGRRREASIARSARELRSEFEAGGLVVWAPPLLFLEMINVAGPRWRWAEERLARLAGALDELAFELVEPELRDVARWVAAGLTAYDAAYVAVAEAGGMPVLTADETILEIAGELAERVG